MPQFLEEVKRYHNLDIPSLFDLFSLEGKNFRRLLESRENLPIFTFVRDPFKRFNSGFAEAVLATLNPLDQRYNENFDPIKYLYTEGLVSPDVNAQVGPKKYLNRRHESLEKAARKVSSSPRRTLLPGAKANTPIQFRKVNASVLAKFFDRFFSLDNRLVLSGHFYPMAGVFFQNKISLLGRLETFEKDWADISKRLLGRAVPYDYKLGEHLTSSNLQNKADSKNGTSTKEKDDKSDPNNTREALAILYAQDKR